MVNYLSIGVADLTHSHSIMQGSPGRQVLWVSWGKWWETIGPLELAKFQTDQFWFYEPVLTDIVIPIYNVWDCVSIAHFRRNHDNQIYSWWFEVLVCGPHRTAAAVAVDQMAGTNAWGISFKGTPGHQPGLPWKMAGIWMESHVMKRWFSYIRWHSWTMAFRRPFAGGGVGHVLTFMWTCRWRTCYAVAAGRCMYSWVGWGGTITSMALSFIGHATLLYVLLNFALMRHATLLYVLLNFALMGHATHPSVTQYVFMWWLRSSL